MAKQIFLRPGNVVRCMGQRWRVSKVNDCCATCEPMAAKNVEIEFREFGEEAIEVKKKTIKTYSRPLSICSTYWLDDGETLETGAPPPRQKKKVPDHGFPQPEDEDTTTTSSAGVERQNQMKTKTKTAKANKPQGKIAFMAEQLLSGGKTISQVVAMVLRKFPGSNEKTTTNSVRWTASHYIPETLGKKSRHVVEARATAKPKAKSIPPARKPAKRKSASRSGPPAKPAAKRSAPPPRPAAAMPISEPASAETPAEPVAA